MSKLPSLIWILVGIGAGSSGTWFVSHRLEKRNAPKFATIRYLDDMPELWLLPPEYTVRDFFYDPGAQAILEAPERITLHEAASGGDSITYDGYSFRSIGTEVTSAPVLYSVRSLSSYRAISACMFNPVVLLRITRAGRNLDLLFCFSCNDVYAYSGGERMGAGISEEGRRSFIRYFHSILPNNPALKAIYDSYPKIHNG